MENLKELFEDLSKFQGEMKPVVFDSENPYFKSKYASLSALVQGASPVLAKYGLSVSQVFEADGTVVSNLCHKSGGMLTSKLKLSPVKNDPQGIGSAITYARRYSYAAILGIVSDSDDDANAASRQDTKHTLPVIKKIASDDPISDDQLKRLFAICTEHKIDKEEAKIIISNYGYASSKEIKIIDYDNIIKNIYFLADMKKTFEETKKD